MENFKIKTDGRVMAEASLKFTEALKFNASIGRMSIQQCALFLVIVLTKHAHQLCFYPPHTLLTYPLHCPLTSYVEDGRQEPGKPLRSFGILGMNFLSPSGAVAVQGDIDVVNGPTLYGSTMLKYNQCFKFGVEVREDG